MKKSNKNLRTIFKTSVLTASLTMAQMTMAGGNDHYEKNSGLKDAWIDGKVESALLVNRHLNNFTIDTHVNDGVVTLSGSVKSDVDKDLAQEIAKGIGGVEQVENNLIVKPDYEDKSHGKSKDDKDRTVGQWYDDSTTTAVVKSKLLWNSETSGLDVNVDTHYGVVTLTGTVDGSAEKDLIVQIAKNTDGVRDVENNLVVAKKS